MSDELLDDTKKQEEGLDYPIDGDEEKETPDDIEPSELPLDDTEDLPEEAVVNPEAEDLFGLGAFGELNDDGEYEAPNLDDDDEVDDEEISDDLF